MLNALQFLIIVVLASSFYSHLTKNHRIHSINKDFQSSLSRTIGNVIAFSAITTLSFQKNALAINDPYVDALTTMILSKQIILPSILAVRVQSYDRARTNIQYILKQLYFQKQVSYLIKNCIDYVDDADLIDVASEAAGRIANELTQYDSSIYTCVFIPSEDGTIPPSAEKYRKEANNYYLSFLKDIDVLISLGTADQLSIANKQAEQQLSTLPKVLFYTEEGLQRTGI